MIRMSPPMFTGALRHRASNWGDVFILDWEEYNDWVAREWEEHILSLGNEPLNASEVSVYVNDTLQEAGEDYAIVGTDGSITLNNVPELGAEITVVVTYGNGITSVRTIAAA